MKNPVTVTEGDDVIEQFRYDVENDEIVIVMRITNTPIRDYDIGSIGKTVADMNPMYDREQRTVLAHYVGYYGENDDGTVTYQRAERAYSFPANRLRLTNRDEIVTTV